jgi:hypothetical protein
MGNPYNMQLKIVRKRPVCGYMDNIKISFKKIRGQGVGEIELAQNRVQVLALISSVMNFKPQYKQENPYSVVEDSISWS